MIEDLETLGTKYMNARYEVDSAEESEYTEPFKEALIEIALKLKKG